MALDLMSPSYLYKINMTFFYQSGENETEEAFFQYPNGLSCKDCSTYSLKRIFQSNLHV